ncbi:hypothetical protein FHR76_004550 [Rhizobium sp. RAS22]|nr:hypothetical protein [Rhizobium sp. RAS22]MBP2614213.1 hypothetical protein [Agrobacterium pusense]
MRHSPRMTTLVNVNVGSKDATMLSLTSQERSELLCPF